MKLKLAFCAFTALCCSHVAFGAPTPLLPEDRIATRDTSPILDHASRSVDSTIPSPDLNLVKRSPTATSEESYKASRRIDDHFVKDMHFPKKKEQVVRSNTLEEDHLVPSKLVKRATLDSSFDFHGRSRGDDGSLQLRTRDFGQDPGGETPHRNNQACWTQVCPSSDERSDAAVEYEDVGKRAPAQEGHSFEKSADHPIRKEAQAAEEVDQDEVMVKRANNDNGDGPGSDPPNRPHPRSEEAARDEILEERAPEPYGLGDGRPKANNVVYTPIQGGGGGGGQRPPKRDLDVLLAKRSPAPLPEDDHRGNVVSWHTRRSRRSPADEVEGQDAQFMERRLEEEVSLVKKDRESGDILIASQAAAVSKREPAPYSIHRPYRALEVFPGR